MIIFFLRALLRSLANFEVQSGSLLVFYQFTDGFLPFEPVQIIYKWCEGTGDIFFFISGGVIDCSHSSSGALDQRKSGLRGRQLRVAISVQVGLSPADETILGGLALLNLLHIIQ